MLLLNNYDYNGERMAKKKKKKLKRLTVRVSGPKGIGRTRLARAMKQWVIPGVELKVVTSNISAKDQRVLLLEKYRNSSREAIRSLQQQLFNAQMGVSVFKWRTHEGQLLQPKEMEDRHLQNTICFLQRMLVNKFGSVTYLKSTISYVQALYEMLKEAERRGLSV